ncbi:14-3-3 protein zeta/delta [Artemisia annua]|uniref:14-3-3 protein zeta/delta n=1 Tax=Artemisia annua TaxID=35608 RepID=A0A2U1LFL5_ARTAN|nr:14-3-3 protein zeta/delta [Artemisia annua]
MDSREGRDTSSRNMRDDKDSVYNSKERVELVEKAKHAEQAKRYDDMLVAMHEVAKQKFELNEEERNLWILAFTNLTQEKGQEIRNLNEKKKKSKKPLVPEVENVKNWTKPSLEDRIKSIKESVNTLCINMITIIEKYLLPTSLTPDSKALYYLMKAICYQYMAESSRSAIEAQKLNEKAIEAYEKGSMVAHDELPATNLLRLDIAFYFSVLCSAMSRHERACSIANEAIKEVLDDIRKHSDE